MEARLASVFVEKKARGTCLAFAKLQEAIVKFASNSWLNRRSIMRVKFGGKMTVDSTTRQEEERERERSSLVCNQRKHRTETKQLLFNSVEL